MKRYHVVFGTKTTAGGDVITASSTRSINGVKFALEGDKIYCPACKSEGVIRCHGPRLNDTWNGINFALEHDLCICRCKAPPTLMTAQTFSFQTVDGSGFSFFGSGEGTDGNTFIPQPPPIANHSNHIGVPEAADQRFLLLDDVTGEPLENRLYRLKFRGTTTEGRTDARGLTETIDGSPGEEVEIEVFAESTGD